MITERDLQEAIAECEGIRNPTSSTCLKLAAYYTLQDKMFRKEPERPTYSFAKGPPMKQVDKVSYSSDTEFSKAILGKDMNEVLEIIDELMSVLEATNPRLYSGVMRKIEY